MVGVSVKQASFKVTTGGYLQRAGDLRRKDGLNNLFYSAFELRCALERTMVDFLVLLVSPKPSDEFIRDGEYKPRAILARIREQDQEFEKRLRFSSLVLQASGRIRSNVPFDFDWVAESHDILNGYLHHQKDPEFTVNNLAWVSEFAERVDSISSKLLSMWKSNRGLLKDMNWTGDQVYQLFRSGKYADDEIIRMLWLSDLSSSLTGPQS